MSDEEIRSQILDLKFEDEKEGKVARLLMTERYNEWTEGMRKWFLLLISRNGKKFALPDEKESSLTEKNLEVAV